uniref:Uncharacterized protein n=1 Tax=Arion vulgaris TaxID=1028688 RepID=A0A0B6ZU59_9EUPU
MYKILQMYFQLETILITSGDKNFGNVSSKRGQIIPQIFRFSHFPAAPTYWDMQTTLRINIVNEMS